MEEVTSFASNAQTDDETSIALLTSVCKQVEYYFGDDNYRHDRFLRKQEDGAGYVPLSVVCEFKKIKDLFIDHTDIDIQ